MPSIDVERSITIDAPVDKIYAAIADFKTWRTWSPWLIMEPEAKVEVAADGSSYAWEVGASLPVRILRQAPDAEQGARSW